MGFVSFVELDPTDVKTQTSTKIHPLGTRGITSDGRVYRYAYAGAALVAGVPVQTIASTLLDNDTAYTAPINDTEEISTTWRSFTVETETATGEIAANEYADGWVRVATSTASAAAGQLIRIKSHDASATSSTDALGSTMTIVFADDDKLAVTLTTGAVTILHHNPYYGVLSVAGGATPAGGCVGVPNIAFTSAYYGWVQTWGPCAVLQDGVLIQGQNVIVSTSTSDAVAVNVISTSTDAYPDVIPASSSTRQTVGWSMVTGGTDAYFGLIFLTISP